jgi:hypothetical protein
MGARNAVELGIAHEERKYGDNYSFKYVELPKHNFPPEFRIRVQLTNPSDNNTMKDYSPLRCDTT